MGAWGCMLGVCVCVVRMYSVYIDVFRYGICMWCLGLTA